ncbi:MAG: hypothetical protein RR415_10095 [Ruthenibacterium sp.]
MKKSTNISKKNAKKIEAIYNLCCEVLLSSGNIDDNEIYTCKEVELLNELANVANAYDCFE